MAHKICCDFQGAARQIGRFLLPVGPRPYYRLADFNKGIDSQLPCPQVVSAL